MTVAMTALTAGILLLSAANVRERALRAEAVEQRERAEHNFSMAQDAVREYYVLVSEDTLLKQRGMQPLRDLLLEQALEYYQRFLEQRQDDPTLRKEIAQAHFFAGRITETVDSADKALPHYQRALELQRELLREELLQEKPSQELLQFNYGQTLNAIGRAMQNLGRLKEARKYYQQAIEQREKLATAQPDNAEYGRTLASSMMNVGWVHLRKNELEQSIEFFNRAQTIRLAHVETVEKADLKMQRDLGKGYYSLSLAQLSFGEVGLAESNLLTAIDLFKRLLESDPQDMENQRRLGISYRMLGDVLAGGGLGGEAITAYQQALETLQSLCERNPDVPEYAADLAGVLMNLGHQFQQAEKFDAALETMQKAASVLQRLAEEFEAMPRYRRDLGVAQRVVGNLLAQTGQSEDAREKLVESKTILQQLVREHPANRDFTTELGKSIDALAELNEQPKKP